MILAFWECHKNRWYLIELNSPFKSKYVRLPAHRKSKWKHMHLRYKFTCSGKSRTFFEFIRILCAGKISTKLYLLPAAWRFNQDFNYVNLNILSHSSKIECSNSCEKQKSKCFIENFMILQMDAILWAINYPHFLPSKCIWLTKMCNASESQQQFSTETENILR